MKVAIFGDVHGNLLALERFLEVTRGTVDTFICLGDIVNYGPWNDECLEIIHQLPGLITVEGNHERMFLGHEALNDGLPLVEDFYRHSFQSFSRSDLIDDLPVRVRLEGYCCTHTIDHCTVYPDTEIEIDQDYIVGHTHHQFRIQRSGFTIINPGSVGQNRRWIDDVDFGVFDSERCEFTLHSAPYDVDRFLEELRKRGYPDRCIRYYADKPRRPFA